eukprot:GHVR01003553.1.p2 GENE.GHVR01003553.1~~GHVR01003553.1.p2  ORF type:complete len:123 (-),score=13.10 GHVR01003553.1:9-377(-)
MPQKPPGRFVVAGMRLKHHVGGEVPEQVHVHCHPKFRSEPFHDQACQVIDAHGFCAIALWKQPRAASDAEIGGAQFYVLINHIHQIRRQLAFDTLFVFHLTRLENQKHRAVSWAMQMAVQMY